MLLWLVLNSLGIFILFVVAYISLRQIGMILGRLGPVGARTDAAISPRIGENITPFTNRLTADSDLPRLFIFASEACSVCKSVRTAANALSQHWHKEINIVMVYDKALSEQLEAGQGYLAVAADERLRHDLGVKFVPFAVRTDANGRVIGRGLVNNSSQIESLLEIRERKPDPGSQDHGSVAVDSMIATVNVN